MKKSNQILIKHLWPSFLTGGIAITSIFTTLAIVGAQEIKNKKEVKAQDVLVAVIVFSAISFLFHPLIDSYKESNKFASDTARKYLQQCFKEHPELKEYEYIFKNPHALKSITTMISNSLNLKEQQCILYEISKVQRHAQSSSKEKMVVMRDAQKQIIAILQEHAATHPEFVKEIYAQMKFAETTYVIPSQQNVR